VKQSTSSKCLKTRQNKCFYIKKHPETTFFSLKKPSKTPLFDSKSGQKAGNSHLFCVFFTQKSVIFNHFCLTLSQNETAPWKVFY